MNFICPRCYGLFDRLLANEEADREALECFGSHNALSRLELCDKTKVSLCDYCFMKFNLWKQSLLHQRLILRIRLNKKGIMFFLVAITTFVTIATYLIVEHLRLFNSQPKDLEGPFFLSPEEFNKLSGKTFDPLYVEGMECYFKIRVKKEVKAWAKR